MSIRKEELYNNTPVEALLTAENVKNVIKAILSPDVYIDEGIVRKGGSSSTINVKKGHEGKRYLVILWPKHEKTNI